MSPAAMAQINDPKIAFAYLRPACVLLTREPTLANVQALGAQLRDVDDATLQQLQDYVLFPLRFVLKVPGPKREAVVVAVAETMSYVLENTCVRSWETLRDVLSELCLCVCCPTDPGKPAAVSEELKLAVLRCLDGLLHAAYGDITFRLFEPIMLPGLGAAVSLLLAVAEQDKSRSIQALALKCLQALALQCDCSLDHVVPSTEERRALSATMASFLPGITITLSRIITGDLKQGHAVTVRALKMWSRAVGLVMEDCQLEKCDAVGTAPSSPPGLGKISKLVVQRTQDWVKVTSHRLTAQLKNIISCVSAHQHWRVRLELVELADHVLARCSQSLGECVGPLLEVLVGSVNDEDTRIRERCSSVLSSVSERIQGSGGGGGGMFTDVLSENLHVLASSLPRLMRTSDDHKKLLVLNVFLGYLKVLGPTVSVVLNSAAHLQRVSKALMQVLELDVMNVRIVEERSTALSIDGSSRSQHPNTACSQKKNFLYFTDEKIFSALMELCRTLGCYGDIYLLTDHFLDLYRESWVYRKQAAMVLNQVIMGAASGAAGPTVGHGTETETRPPPPHSLEDLRAAVVSVLEEYTSLNNWNLPTVTEDHDGDAKDQETHRPFMLPSVSNNELVVPSSLSTSSPSRSTVHRLNGNIWQLCIQLEGVACFARALGRGFRPLLMASLYHVLEKAGGQTLLVSQAALDSMWGIGDACGYGSPGELIGDNADYLLNHVSLNLRRLSLHPQAPRVLTVMLAHSNPSLLPLVGDVIQDVLVALDLSYNDRAPLFCSILHSVMKALVSWFPSSHGSKSEYNSKKTTSPEALNVRQFLLDYCKQKELAEGIAAEEDDNEDPAMPPSPQVEEEEEGPDVKEELPSHLQITKDIMERCIHLLSHPSQPLRLKVLDVLELCVLVLSERENELLPMAHRCWPALLQRLTADDPLAVLRAFRVLFVLGETCGDFLRQRVSKEVLPKLTSSLSRQAVVSARASPVYTHTLAYKLQLAVLQGLGSLCLALHLGETDLDSVCEACLPYLSCRQPIRLQEACLSVFQHLIQVDPDTIWFTLSELHCPFSYDPPHPDLPPIRLNGTGQPRDEYTDNLLKLLREEFSLPVSQSTSLDKDMMQ